jgi:hypothetical protein
VKTQNPETSKRRTIAAPLSKEQQVKTIMDQINSIHPTGIVQPPQPDLSIPITPNPVPPSPAPPPPPPAPVPPKVQPPTPAAPQFIEDVIPMQEEEPTLDIAQNDVVQVTGKDSRVFGLIFTVGGIRGDDVHGYYVFPGGDKGFVTEQYGRLTKIGVASVLSRTPCQADWLRQQ